MEDQSEVEVLGRAAAIEFALAAIIKHLPDDARRNVHGEIRLFLERSDVRHESGRATADAARSILKEFGRVGPPGHGQSGSADGPCDHPSAEAIWAVAPAQPL